MLFLLSLLLVTSPAPAKKSTFNPFLGKWKSVDIRSFNEEYKIEEGEFSDFTSTIEFREDLTFTKTTNNKVTRGRYTFTKTKLRFYEPNFNNGQTPSWSIRQPEEKLLNNVNYPELFTTRDGTSQVELDVYYRKANEF